MAKEKRSMEELFQTLPELPEDFKNWCISRLPDIPIFYRRDKKGTKAECTCGKCAGEFIVNNAPCRHTEAICPLCGHTGKYEWKKVTRASYSTDSFYLVQKTTSGELVARIFIADQDYKQGRIANIKLTEQRRYFLTFGDVYKYYYAPVYFGSKGWGYEWGKKSDYVQIPNGEIYPGYTAEVKKSCLKYCDISYIQQLTKYRMDNYLLQGQYIIDILIAFSNNPAIEMYAKAGMSDMVKTLIFRDGKDRRINRRGKSLNAQLRLKDKAAIKILIENKGDMDLLDVLQMETKHGYKWTSEQELFLRDMFKYADGMTITKYLLQYMTLQQMMNRADKYIGQRGTTYYGKISVLRTYYDYLRMREELGYDMTNEVYLYPKKLKVKHDQMVKEREARRDELYIKNKMNQYSDIEKRYEKLVKKYWYADDGYVIRPARDAGEIITEGRVLHHCVGGDWYLSKHAKGTTTILMLRKEENPDVPYYTIEIEDKKILQWYGKNDKKPDKEIIEPWLSKYVEHLKAGKEKAPEKESQQMLAPAAG